MRMRLGPLLACAVLGLVRAVWLSQQISGGRAIEVAYLLLADVPVLGALALLAVVEARSGRRWKPLVLLFSVVLVSLYVADVGAVLALNARLQVDDIRKFAVEWWLLPGFLNLKLVTVLALVAVSFFLKIPVRPRFARSGVVAGAILVALTFMGAPQAVPIHLQKYAGSVFLLARELWGIRKPPVSRYGEADFRAYGPEYDALFDAPFARSRTSIILVIVESLSSVDSFRTSGLRNLLPRFDELSREGVLFRNFAANFEASEGGIVALLSGVPPVHFPTASTNTFAEYARQRAITATFAGGGYRCEFLTSVPIDFISMQDYARSPRVGFSHAAGQREIARYTGAPKYAFESPADHLLYEEILARLSPAGVDPLQPVFLAAITASSHPPFVDPLGRGDNEANAWSYVQEQLWWLYQELDRRRYFDNGVLIITGDHRKMYPVSEQERERYGDSAKARIPLVIIGKGAARGAVDDRLFQQADLLRMLDRALQPGPSLSPFTLWSERYVFVFGIASNATNIEVFEPSDHGHRGYRLNVRGTEIDWTTRPASALAVERSLHRQRAIQQARREAAINQPLLNHGRDLRPAADGARGMLIGISSDGDLARDPDDPRGGLRLFTSQSFDLAQVRAIAGPLDRPFTMTVRGFLEIDREGPYWFSAFADRVSCLAIDGEVILGCHAGLNEGLALLTAGRHRIELRYYRHGPRDALRLKWLPPGAREFVDFPQERLVVPAS